MARVERLGSVVKVEWVVLFPQKLYNGFAISHITKIFVDKHCFCYLIVENVEQRDSLFHQPIAFWLAY